MSNVGEWNWSTVAEVVPLPPGWSGAPLPNHSQPVVAVVGYGYWGQKLAAAVRKQGATVIPVDPNQPNTQTWETVLADPTVQGVMIATPEKTHAELALAALRAGKAVLVEKPAATTVKDWQKVSQLAQKLQLPVWVDYTFLLSRAALVWQTWQTRFASELGELKTLKSTRLANLTPARIAAKGVAVWMDAAIHDLYLIRWLWAAQPGTWQISAAVGTPPVAATLTTQLQLPHSKVQFQADYSWTVEIPQRTWLATYAGGTLRWERRGGADWLQAATQSGKILAELSLDDSDPSPLDRTTQVFLAWLVAPKPWSVSIQKQWQTYWAAIQQDITQLVKIQ